MTIRKGWLALALLILVLFTLCATAPARVLSHVLPPSSIVLQGLSGSVWRGQAAGCLIQVPGGFMQLGHTRWTVSPLSLLLLAPRVSVSSRWGEQLLRADLIYSGTNHLRASAVEARINAGLLQSFLPVTLDGTLVISMDSVEVKRGIQLVMDGRLVWENARWLSPDGAVRLGSYAVNSRQVDRDIQADILTLTGPLLADGSITLSHAAETPRYELTVDLTSEGSMDPQLQQALSLMASPTSAGYRLVLQGQLPPAG